MVKKSIIALVLMGMLATVSYGQDYPEGQYKVDGLWPVTLPTEIYYTPVELCRIPVFIKVGMFIEIENCNSKKIVMEQVNCPGGQSFPCYKGCVGLKIRANFEAKLTLKKEKIGDIISGGWGGDKWKAYFTDDGGASTSETWLVSGDGNWNYVDLCVEAWDANIYNAAPDTQAPVGEIAILAVPQAIPDICDYLDGYNCD